MNEFIVEITKKIARKKAAPPTHAILRGRTTSPGREEFLPC
jgi:hypothetical protein